MTDRAEAIAREIVLKYWHTSINTTLGVVPLQDAIASALRASEERAEKAEAERDETWTDENGEVWDRPTAFAYAKACMALRYATDRAEAAEARVKELEAALRDARNNGLIYWEPCSQRGHITKAQMLARIDTILTALGDSHE